MVRHDANELKTGFTGRLRKRTCFRPCHSPGSVPIGSPWRWATFCAPWSERAPVRSKGRGGITGTKRLGSYELW